MHLQTHVDSEWSSYICNLKLYNINLRLWLYIYTMTLRFWLFIGGLHHNYDFFGEQG